MYCNVTKRIQSGLDKIWEEATLSSNLSGSISVNAYLKILQDHRNWNTLSFSLRRYLYLRFTQRSPEEDPIPYTVVFQGCTYVFSPVSPDVEISAQEKQEYAELMYRMTLHNRCFYRSKNGVTDPKKGAISKQQYLNYLNDHRMYRKNLFPLSVALGFDYDSMTQFMSVLGESPVYNFRNAIECIYYFCHCAPSLNNWETTEYLLDRYSEIQKDAVPAPADGAGMTAQLGCDIEDIVYDEDLSDLERKEAFLAFLEENISQFTQYSQTARELLAKELNSEQLLDTLKPHRNPLSAPDKLQGAFIHPDQVDNALLDEPGIQGGGVFDDLFAALYREKCGDILKVRKLDLDSRMTANLTDSAHLRGVFGGALSAEGEKKPSREPVTKQDFLLVRLHKFDALLKSHQYSAEERLEFIKKFRSSTDRILTRAGLPKIYVSNPLDHMVLTALCQKDPAQFTQTLYYLAAKEDLHES